MPEVIVIAHNIRSAHNIGSILRTCDGFGVTKLIISGHSPYPAHPGDGRLPHISAKLTAQIHKTALGAEQLVPFEYQAEPDFAELRRLGFLIVGLEQDPQAVSLPAFRPPEKIALLLGEEIHGLTDELKDCCDTLVEIPMFGQKESFNVSIACGVALYHITCGPSAT